MHCPKCGQQQVSEETRYCSRCGLLLTGIAQVVRNEGVLPGSKGTSPRIRGIKQGTFLFLSFFLLVPISVMISLAANLEPFLPVILFFITIVGGLMRVAYAFMFESNVAPPQPAQADKTVGSQGYLNGASPSALPPQTANAHAFAPPRSGKWMDTNELSPQPSSVTEPTTKLLTKEDESQ